MHKTEQGKKSSKDAVSLVLKLLELNAYLFFHIYQTKLSFLEYLDSVSSASPKVICIPVS